METDLKTEQGFCKEQRGGGGVRYNIFIIHRLSKNKDKLTESPLMLELCSEKIGTKKKFEK